jgi:diguanylate cyclase (GGDEF)-like protein
MGKTAATENQTRIKKEFIRSNFILNLQRLQIAFIVFFSMGLIYLVLIYYTGLFETAPQEIFKYLACIILAHSAWIAMVNSSLFVGFAYLISLLTRNLRWSDFLKERRIREQNMELAHMANTDYLTNLYNKRYAYSAMRMEWNRSLRSEKPLSLILVDIDCFKDYNDAYGHIQGDQCLKEVADVVRRSARRKTDQVCRFGGEELLVILPYTSGVDAYAIGEKIRMDVAGAAIPHQNSVVAPVVTVSAGVASMVGDRNTNFEALLERADRALYRAKHNGRNMVVM